MQPEGILLIDKPAGITSFSVIARLRKIFHVQTIGHAGTLDPFATGVLVILVGRKYTRMQDQFLVQDKEYRAIIQFGSSTDTHDCDGKVMATSTSIPSLEDVEVAIRQFQGMIEQVPPMFSAKKIQGKRLYELARLGAVVERKSVTVHVAIELVRYQYPELEIHVKASKGTYIRQLAYDIGKKLGVEAHVSALRRTRAGSFHIDDCIPLDQVAAGICLRSSI